MSQTHTYSHTGPHNEPQCMRQSTHKHGPRAWAYTPTIHSGQHDEGKGTNLQAWTRIRKALFVAASEATDFSHGFMLKKHTESGSTNQPETCTAKPHIPEQISHIDISAQPALARAPSRTRCARHDFPAEDAADTTDTLSSK